MARYGIRPAKAFGVSMETMRPLAKRLGRDHDLALALWASGWHEARILAALVDDPRKVTRRQMDAWARAFDNWAVCDTVCIHLFNRSRYAWEKVRLWSRAREEFVRRAAFATAVGLTVHDRAAPDEAFTALLVLIEETAADERPMVSKAVNWALRQVGKRNTALWRRALPVARRMAKSDARAKKWVGTDALRELTSVAVMRRLGMQRA